MSKPQLTSSMISMLYRCGEQFRRRYGARFGHADREEIVPPGIALITGIGVHKSVEANLNTKIETGSLLDVDQVADIARDAVAGLWQKEVHLSDEEALQDRKHLKGDCIDTSVALSVLHAGHLAPKLKPVKVEHKFVLTLKEYPYDLAGTYDIEEEGGVIRDTKTASKSPTQSEADTSEQLTMYSLAKKVCDGKPPARLFLDKLVKTKIPKLVTLETERNDFQRQVLFRRIERATEIIEAGRFTPANPQDWWCSRKWCGYFDSCPFGGKP